MQCYSLVSRRALHLGLGCLAAAVLLAACGDPAEPAATSSSTTSPPGTTTTLPPPTAAATTTTVPPITTVPTTAVPPTTTTTLPPATGHEGPEDIDLYAVWQDVFDALTPAEQACVRDAVGAELDWVLSLPILDEDDVTQQELAVFPCLPPQVVRAVFLAGMVLGLEDEGVEVGEEQEACLREVFGGMDVAALTSVLAAEGGVSDEAAGAEAAALLLEVMAGVLRCVPELFDEGGDETDDFADGVVGAARVVLGEVVEGMLEYGGDVDYFVFEAVGGELYEIDVDLGTLSDSVVAIADADGYPLGFNDDRGDGSLGSRLVWRAPESGDFYVEVSGFGEDSYSLGSYSLTVGVSDIVDEYADGVLGAARMVLGESVEGMVDYPADVDYFVFEGVEDELYQVDVDLGTLPDSVVAVFNADGWELGYDHYRNDSLGSRLVWRAPESGDFFVAVGGSVEGSYTLTVGVSDIVDDYANGVKGAARVALGEAVEGTVDYPADVDYFVFEAGEGELYEIGVDLGTLFDSRVTVYDADGFSLGYNDDRDDDSLASRLSWRAHASGDFYVEVAGFDSEGSYVLTVVVSE